MMRKIKNLGLFLALVILFSLIFCPSAAAEGETYDTELYKKQLELSGADRLKSALPDDANRLLEDFEIDPESPEAMLSVSGEEVFKTLFEALRQGVSAPLKTTLTIIGILLVFASFEGFLKPEQSQMSLFVCFVSAIIAASSVFSIMEAVKLAVQSVSTFMISLVPVYTGIMLSSGRTAASGGFATLLLGASEAVSYLIAWFFVPVSGAVTCLSICSAISPVGGVTRLAEWIKKSANWAMGIATTLFLGVLSIQNTFSSTVDGLGIRASKAMLSTTLPIMGPAIAETVNTARGCLDLLRSSVGIYAVIAIAVLSLPIIIQLILWRCSMWLCSAVAEIFSQKQTESLLKSIDFCLSVLLSAVLFTALLFVIALGVTFKG